jgi:hypothetical protein
MTTAAPATGAPLGSLTLPAIAPVLAVWPYIGREQRANAEMTSKLRLAGAEMFHMASSLKNHQKEGSNLDEPLTAGRLT